jgi:2-keto-4-pentenoate hydratase/2-oxohepta-3-ene-1,7-dioic acid hydratase in catechol pathway
MSTIWCIGRNYPEHARELGNPVPTEPLVFLKAWSAQRGLEPAPMAFADEAFHHELELVLELGADVPLGVDPGWAVVSAVRLGLDLTRRAEQARIKAAGLPWTTAKSFGGSAVLGPPVPSSEVGDPGALTFTLHVDGQLRQQGAFRDALFDAPTLLRHLARLAPLRRGDLVFTGTPPGVADIRVGQGFELALHGPTTWRWSGQL